VSTPQFCGFVFVVVFAFREQSEQQPGQV